MSTDFRRCKRLQRAANKRPLEASDKVNRVSKTPHPALRKPCSNVGLNAVSDRSLLHPLTDSMYKIRFESFQSLRLCVCVIKTHFLPERDYVTFGSLLSQFRLSVVCRLSVTLVHPTQGVEPFGKISSPLYTLKFYRYRPRGTPPPSGALNARGVPKYSDFRPIEGYTS